MVISSFLEVVDTSSFGHPTHSFNSNQTSRVNFDKGSVSNLYKCSKITLHYSQFYPIEHFTVKNIFRRNETVSK